LADTDRDFEEGSQILIQTNDLYFNENMLVSRILVLPNLFRAAGAMFAGTVESFSNKAKLTMRNVLALATEARH
jgi:hypothetical protein